MTVADIVRSMNDVDLAQFLYTIISERDKVISESLAEQGIPNSIISIPSLGLMHHLKFLRQPAENVFSFEGEEEADNG